MIALDPRRAGETKMMPYSGSKDSGCLLGIKPISTIVNLWLVGNFSIVRTRRTRNWLCLDQRHSAGIMR